MTTADNLTIEQKNVAMLGDKELEAMGNRIREAREKKGIKQIELALQLAIGKNQMYRIIRTRLFLILMRLVSCRRYSD